MLKVEPTASHSDVEHAIEAQYNQWRRLVTHHTPEVANAATQALEDLDVIRGTLLDEGKHEVYDRSIGLRLSVGGLADPSSLLQSVMGAPTAPPAPTIMSVTAKPESLWACYRCGTENPTQTKFCLKCGAQLVRKCPECNTDASLVASGICSNCGSHFNTASKRIQLRQNIIDRQQVLANLEHQLAEIESTAERQSDGTYADPIQTPLNPLSVSVPLIVLGGLLLALPMDASRAFGPRLLGIVLMLAGCALYLPLRRRFAADLHALSAWSAEFERETATLRNQIAGTQEEIERCEAELNASILAKAQ